ncbi:MAG TPA: OsmC family protein [Bryobacteraceae bacterium]|jgi:putative redox protein|nr:OsmC family protein [Bryobacteraceae bacterium]
MANEIKIAIRQTSAATSEAAIRQHKTLIDRPAAKGGDDQGPMGGELFLAAIGGCFMSNLLAAIKGREAAISDAHTDVIGVLDGSPARFTAVELNVTAKYSDREQFEKLIDIADRGCIMMNTLRGKLDIQVRIAALV